MDHRSQIKRIHHGAGHALRHLPHAVRADGELLLWQLDADDTPGNRAEARPGLLGGPAQAAARLDLDDLERGAVRDGDGAALSEIGRGEGDVWGRCGLDQTSVLLVNV